MKRKLSVLLVVLLITALTGNMLGCSKGKSNSGIVTISLEGEPIHLDEGITTATTTWWVAAAINDYLLVFDEEMNIQKSLLDDYSMTDELTFKFTLRKGVKFHNGREVKASDVKFSLERQLDSAVASAYADAFSCIDSIEVVDDYNGIIYLKEPYAPFLTKLTKIPIIPEECADTLKTAPVGCGPFKFVSWEHDQKITLEAFADYWKEGYPKSSGLVFKILPEYNSQLASFMASETDIMLWLNNSDIEKVSAVSGVTVRKQPILDAYYLLLNCTAEPFDDPLVRKAISLAVDREACVKSALSGYGDVVYSPVNCASYYYDDSLAYDRDIATAKSLLAKAGFSSGFTCKLVTPQTTVEGPLGDLIQSQLAEIGITVEVEKLEVNTFLDRTFGNKDFEMMVCGDSGDGDPETFAYNYLYSQSETNLGSYENAEFDELIQEGRATYDAKLRKDIYLEAFTLLKDDSPMTFIMGGVIYSALQSGVEGLVGFQTQKFDYSGVIKK